MSGGKANPDSSVLDEDKKLLLAIVSTPGVPFDWNRICAMLGIPRKGTAQVRWYRLKDKFKDFLESAPDAADAAIGISEVVTPKKKGKKQIDNDSDDDEEVRVKKPKTTAGMYNSC
jgi:hypothetical protein